MKNTKLRPTHKRNIVILYLWNIFITYFYGYVLYELYIYIHLIKIKVKIINKKNIFQKEYHNVPFISLFITTLIHLSKLRHLIM